MNADGSQNYRHHAVLELGRVHADGGAYGDAYRSARRAENEYPRENWCGTCSSSFAARRQRSLATYAFLSWNPMGGVHLLRGGLSFDGVSLLILAGAGMLLFIALLVFFHVRLCRKEEAEKARSSESEIDSVSA